MHAHNFTPSQLGGRSLHTSYLHTSISTVDYCPGRELSSFASAPKQVLAMLFNSPPCILVLFLHEPTPKLPFDSHFLVHEIHAFKANAQFSNLRENTFKEVGFRIENFASLDLSEEMRHRMPPCRHAFFAFAFLPMARNARNRENYISIIGCHAC